MIGGRGPPEREPDGSVANAGVEGIHGEHTIIYYIIVI